MKSTKYLVLTLIAIAVSGLVWWSNLSPVVSSPTVQLQTEPPLEAVIADETVVKFQLQAVDIDQQPLSNANIQLRLLTPAKTPWLTSDFPIVEGTELLNLQTVSPQGSLEFEQVLPIRGNYRLQVAVRPEVAGTFGEFDQSLTFTVPENGVRYRNLAILAVILLSVGLGSGWILAGEQTVNEREIAPQPVRMLLSGLTMVAIAVLLLVNISAEVAAFNNQTESLLDTSPAIVENETMQLELLGDTQAVVGNLATFGVKVSNPTTGEAITEVDVSIQSVALESDAVMFAYQGTPDPVGKLIWKEQFFDGAPHQVRATVTPFDESSESLQVAQEIDVQGIAPPLLVRFISLFYFTLIFIVGLIAGFWGKRHKIA